ncbi:uncharacterized protein FIBRA_04233 [Fibroporia radiculosa]|uniref:HMG box domain-containing protein n=1 Tax=Fibroporia radiculosa TaxID=599839 RepID=J4GNZ9_9APHY|nr:uncharacterized protein FIBRA_04233 [Fibroporia radiculosa]CCM02155.1 predicted protein [Fibroporia radiculosa]
MPFAIPSCLPSYQTRGSRVNSPFVHSTQSSPLRLSSQHACGTHPKVKALLQARYDKPPILSRPEHSTDDPPADDQVTQEPNASPPQTISFATNLTPGTFNQPASRAKRVAERRLFPTPPPSSTASQTGKRRNTHAKKKPEDHIPRPPNAFILFRSAFIRNNHITTDIETDHSTLSKIIGLTWRKLPQAERDAWFDDAREKLEEHMVKHPNYVFRPVHDKEKASEKRKVREVGLKDTKRCTKIADLLIDGKRGAELGAAVHEFDRHHVPEVVTRFEAPLTARAYRRSVSEPAADEPSSGFVVPLPSGKSGKARASTAQPEMRIATASPQWSEPSLFESESFSQSDAYSSPSTPFTTSQDIYTGSPSTSPFDFGTFTFQECTSASGESYDPLHLRPVPFWRRTVSFGRHILHGNGRLDVFTLSYLVEHAGYAWFA